MTNEEVNKFLESIGGLENGFYPDRGPIMTRNFECSEGWNKLICDLIQGLVDIGWDRQICQIKEKWGGLRFYTNGVTDEMHILIRDAEELSMSTCEVCGTTEGVKLRGNGWVQSVCEEHKN